MSSIVFRGKSFRLGEEFRPVIDAEREEPEWKMDGKFMGPPGDFPSVNKQDMLAGSTAQSFPKEEEDFHQGPPLDEPVTHHRDYYASNATEQPVPPPVCIPPDPSAIMFQTGGSSPLVLGENIVVQSDAGTGITPPITFQWSLNGVPTVTTETYPYTVADGDIVEKDASGLGVIRFVQVVTNDCGEATIEGGFAAQGTPP